MCPHKWSLAQWRKHNEISLVFKLDMWICYIDQQKTDWFEMNLCEICALRIAILLTIDYVTSKNYSLYLRNKKEGALSHTE